MGNVKDWIETKYYQFKREFNIRRFWERIKIWFSYWKVTKYIYDFDYSGLLYLERHQLKRMIKSISHYQNHIDWKTDVMWMKICVGLLDIILNEDDYYDIIVEKDMQFILREDGTEELIPGKYTYVYKKYINMQNAHRYVNTNSLKLDRDIVKSIVREAKAWKLYHQVRESKLQTWWD